MIQMGNTRTVEQGDTQMLPRPPHHHGCAVTLDITADALNSNDNREEDEYNAGRILSGKAGSNTP